MKRIAINIGLKKIRNNRFEVLPIDQVLHVEHLEMEEDLDLVAEEIPQEQLLAIIQNLPPGYRTVFNLYVLDGYSHKEIAKQLKISVSTSRTQLFKAKKMIQAALKAKKNLIAIHN